MENEETLAQALEDISTAIALRMPVYALPGMLVYQVYVHCDIHLREDSFIDRLGLYPSEESALASLSKWCMEKWRDKDEDGGNSVPWKEVPGDAMPWDAGLAPVEPALEYMQTHTPQAIVDEYFAYHNNDMYTLSEEVIKPYRSNFRLL